MTELYQMVKGFDADLKHGGLESVLGYHDDQAIKVVQTGQIVSGEKEIRSVLERVNKSGVTVRQDNTHVLQSGKLHYSLLSGGFIFLKKLVLDNQIIFTLPRRTMCQKW